MEPGTCKIQTGETGVMSEKIRIGLIGVGGIANRHIRDFLATGEANIVAMCDPDPTRLATAKQNFPDIAGAATYSNYKDMLAAGGLDAVEINSPHTLHFDQIMDALDAGLHVLCEKPMVCKTSHARAVIEKARETGKVVMVAYQRHFQPAYRYIKEMVESGTLGEVTFIAALQCQNWKNPTSGTWRQNPELSGGGQLNDSGSHLMDIVLWTSGLTPETVHGYIDNCGTPVDVNSALSIKFTNGAQGTVSVVGQSVCNWWEEFTIWGTKGVIFYRNGKLMVCNEDGEMSEPTDLPEGSNVNKGFIDCIMGRDKNWVPAECGLRVIELTEAAWTSSTNCGPCEVASL
jgi:predicted dehydrogenase